MSNAASWPDDNRAINLIRDCQRREHGMTAIRNVQVVDVILIEGTVGSGVTGDPVEHHQQWWTPEGRLIGTTKRMDDE